MKESVTPASKIIPEKVSYPQLDTIRFLTISIIVWSHSLFQEWYSRIPQNAAGEIIQVIVIQMGAMSTVIFFIVSGILMHAKIQHYNLRTYLAERIPRVYAPWLFIVLINAILIAAHQLYAQEIRLTADLNQLMTIAYNIMTALLIYGPYWFVVTYFIGMMILVFFKRYSSNVYFGMLLLLASLFYGLNFYMGWIDTLHTKAVLAYTFFIWLGFQIQSRWDDNLKKVNEIKWILLAPLLILLFGVAAFDGYQLSNEGVKDPYASNRLINIAFSLVFFTALVKIGGVRRINKLQPRKIVFGIYLVNSIIVLELTYLLHDHLSDLSGVHIWALLGLQIIYFSFVFFLTWLIVDYLARSRKLRWIIGGASSKKI